MLMIKEYLLKPRYPPDLDLLVRQEVQQILQIIL